jgi:hypothetical protein
MGFGEPKMPTPEEMAEIQKERTLSDAELIKEGANYVSEADGNLRLEVAKEEIDKIEWDKEREDMENISKERKDKCNKAIESLKNSEAFNKLRNAFSINTKIDIDYFIYYSFPPKFDIMVVDDQAWKEKHEELFRIKKVEDKTIEEIEKEFVNYVNQICAEHENKEKSAIIKKGLSAEKNVKIAEYLSSGDYTGLLDIISREQDKQLACEVILNSMFQFHKGTRTDTINGLLMNALSDIEKNGSALKELILYTYKNNMQGERFWKNPYKDETLFIDDDNELISFQGKVETNGAEMNYISALDRYEVLTGPNKGKIFNASNMNSSSFRPIKGIGATK